MKIQGILVALLTVSGSAMALQPINPPGLLPTEIARPLLEQDPGVAAARAGLDVGRQEANLLDKSPYEWTVRGSAQRRRQQEGARYKEWNVGVERTIRLPGKAAADRNLGLAVMGESEARYGEARHEAARELMSLWVEWLAAERAHKLAGHSLESMQASLAAVEKRVRAGDASQLDLSIARAELAEQRRLNNDAKTQASVAWARLSKRFPGVKRQVAVLPAPLPIGEDAASWRDRILAQSDELKIVQAQLRTAEGRTARAHAEKTPDPTLGIYTASEIGGRERISGVTISIPIPGGAREARGTRAVAAAEVSRQEVELKKRQLDAEIASALASAQGAYDSAQIANEGATAMQENANLMQRAYALGEADLQALMLARRQATAATNNALQAQTTALKAYYGLLVDAHLVWDLEHD